MPKSKLGLNITIAKKNFTIIVNYQFVESLKRHKISKPENFMKSEGLNMLFRLNHK